jgi:hypothetical protein
MEITELIEEIGRFGDLDSPLNHSETNGKNIFHFKQRGESVQLTFLPSGVIQEERNNEEKKMHGSYFGLLSSSNFGDLRTLARMQLALIRNSEIATSLPLEEIPIGGDIIATNYLSTDGSVLDQINKWTFEARELNPLSAIVIDGPAGIGKTHLISSLVKERAESFGPGSRPLVLHIQSRGRQLTTLPDLLARTLQSMRLLVTYEQIPVLAKHGLVQLAIDGFDELADPNGYETAWRSVREFLSEIKGKGVVILAGRDTFIDAEAVRRALPILSASAVAALHMRPPSVQEAITWLQKNGLSEEKVNALKCTSLLDEDSYALRPFFLKQIRAVADSSDGMTHLTSFPLGTLIQEMIHREMKLTAPLGLNLCDQLLQELLQQLFQETAREMADAESDSIDVPSLQLISEIVFSPHILDEPLRALRNRIQSVALLDVDLIPERRRFAHSEIQAYFLANSYIRLLGNVDAGIPRSIRRNIVGSELLEVFHDVTRNTSEKISLLFRDNASEMLKKRRHDDRSPGNVAALMLASLGSIDTHNTLLIEDVSVDECLIRGTATPAKLKRLFISKLDVRDADITEIFFDECTISSLVINSATRLPTSIALPAMLQIDHENGQQTLYKPEDIGKRIEIIKEEKMIISEFTKNNQPILKLLDKMCRTVLRQSWIRDDDDDRAGRLLRDANWPNLRKALQKHDLLEERTDMPAGGRNAQFVRIKRVRDLMNRECEDSDLDAFFGDLERI